MPVLVCTNTSRIVEVSVTDDLKEYSRHMTAFRIMEIYVNRPSKIAVANAYSTVATLAKRQQNTVAKALPVVLIHYRNDDLPCTHQPLKTVNP